MEPSVEETAMPAPCFLIKLPQELLKMILSNLHPPVGSVKDKEYRELINSLLAAMHSCRTLLYAGRPILYREPVFFWAHSTVPLEASSWSYSTFASPYVDAAVSNSTVAAVVHDLPRLEVLIHIDPGDRDPISRGLLQKKALGIQSDILAACTQLTSVSVVLYDLDQAEHVGSLLAAMPNLSSLAISILHAGNKDEDAELYAACLKRLAPSGERALAKLFLVDYQGEDVEEFEDHESQDGPPAVGKGSDSAGEMPAILNRVTAALAIDLRRSHERDAVRSYLPDWAHSIEGVADGLTGVTIKYQWPNVAFTVDQDDMTILTAPCFESNRLTTIELEYEHEDYVASGVPRMESYANSFGRIAYSPSIFGLFHHARKLRLGWSRGLSLQHLEVLAAASPELESLELPSSLWSLTPAELKTDLPEQLSAFEQQLIKTLDRFSHLRRIDLGVWPYQGTSDDGQVVSGRPALQQWASARGLALKLERGFHA
ncbi:hypothetical protein BMF94_4708 [Rhodotorula taiwanensis]|uniref:Uncharacterized protein n=1 Tax=Rhodotorula taiwanensis TaxID=741276 RepID=A0A2S5B696_9BASI|nr:hypothetical protein BMF94_4708 [Rhodotorula taiwanensis]